MADDNFQQNSNGTYPVLEKPKFTPNIPQYLIEGASEQDKYIIQKLDMLDQFAQWSINAHIVTNSEVRHTNGRVTDLEKNKEVVKEDIKTTKDDLKEIYPTSSYLSKAYVILQNKFILITLSLGVAFVVLVLYPIFIRNPNPVIKFVENFFLK